MCPGEISRTLPRYGAARFQRNMHRKLNKYGISVLIHVKLQHISMFLKFCYQDFVAPYIIFSIYPLLHDSLSPNFIFRTLNSMQIGSFSHSSWSIYNRLISYLSVMHSLPYMLYVKCAMDIMIKICFGSEVMFSLCSVYSYNNFWHHNSLESSGYCLLPAFIFRNSAFFAHTMCIYGLLWFLE